MVEEPSRTSVWVTRVLVYGGAAAGIVLVGGAVVAEEPSGWWMVVGLPLALVCGALSAVWIRWRLRYPTPEDRRRHLEGMRARRAVIGQPLDRSRLAHRSTKHKKAVLRSGVDATARVVFVADGRRANEFEWLAYLELEVHRPGAVPYVVETGEYLNAASSGSVAPGSELVVKVDPDDPQRVAVDWERSLRVR